MGSGYRRASKAMANHLQTGERVVAGSIFLPKGGIWRAGLSAGMGQVLDGAILGAVGGAIDGGVEKNAEKRGEELHQVKLPSAMTLVLTDRRFIGFAAK
ncbi:MAG TPA: hypothetical protein VF960_13270, partial [Chloroflexota bacterium]